MRIPVGVLGLSVAFGLGLAAKRVVQLSGPAVSKWVRPVAKAGIRESLVLTKNVQKLAESVKEDVEDLVAEVQHELDDTDSK